MTMLHSLVAAVALGGLAPQAQDGIGDELAEMLEERAVPEDTGLGFMEFFDWYAGCSHLELSVMAGDLLGERLAHEEVESLSRQDRYKLALRIWGAM